MDKQELLDKMEILRTKSLGDIRLPEGMKDVLNIVGFTFSKEWDLAGIDPRRVITFGPKALDLDEDVLYYVLLHEVTHVYLGHMEDIYSLQRIAFGLHGTMFAFAYNLAEDIQVDFFLTRFAKVPDPSENLHGGPDGWWEAVLQSVEAESLTLFGEIRNPPNDGALRLAIKLINTHRLVPSPEFANLMKFK